MLANLLKRFKEINNAVRCDLRKIRVQIYFDEAEACHITLNVIYQGELLACQKVIPSETFLTRSIEFDRFMEELTHIMYAELDRVIAINQKLKSNLGEDNDYS